LKPFDISKFRSSITKSIPGLSVGFHDPKTWISTGNYALNYAISGDFKNGIPLGKVTMLAGESGCLPATAKVKVRYNYSESEITISELKELYNSNDYNIDILTPDGYQPIGQWFNKGSLKMVEITSESFMTRCAINHLIQLENGDWKFAGDLEIGNSVLTLNGIEKIKFIKSIPDEECYDFEIKHVNHRYWGDGFSSHNSGKSFIASGNAVREAQSKNIFCVLLDTEAALDEKWLHNLGVDTSEDKLLKINIAMIDDVAKLISDFMKDYKSKYDSTSYDERPKVLFVIDSLGMLMTPTDVQQFSSGDLKGDFGRKSKALLSLVRNCVNMFGEYEIGLLVTNHSYASQNIFSPDPVISGGSGPIFAASIVIGMQKLKLKEDDDGNKTTDVKGIRSICKVMKTRYNKPFESVEIKIPWETGMDKFSGLFDLFQRKGLFVQDGKKWKYTDKSGVEHKYFEKRIPDSLLELMMDEWVEPEHNTAQNSEIIDDDVSEYTDE